MKEIKIPFIAERVAKLRAVLTAINGEIDGVYNSPAYLNAADLESRDAAEAAAGLAEMIAERRELVTRLNLITGSDCVYSDDAAQIENFFSYRNKLALSRLYSLDTNGEDFRRYQIEHEEAAELVAKLAHRRLQNDGKIHA